MNALLWWCCNHHVKMFTKWSHFLVARKIDILFSTSGCSMADTAAWMACVVHLTPAHVQKEIYRGGLPSSILTSEGQIQGWCIPAWQQRDVHGTCWSQCNRWHLGLHTKHMASRSLWGWPSHWHLPSSNTTVDSIQNWNWMQICHFMTSVPPPPPSSLTNF